MHAMNQYYNEPIMKLIHIIGGNNKTIYEVLQHHYKYCREKLVKFDDDFSVLVVC